MDETVETTELIESVAFLAEQVEFVRTEQFRHNKSVEEVLKVWHQVNLKLLEKLTLQGEDLSGSSQSCQNLTECLIALTKHSGELGVSTTGLKFSLESLTKYLNEEQSPQVVQLAENTAALKNSSADLVTFVTGEQTQRAKTLEDGMRSLLSILEKIPGMEKEKKLVPEKEAMTLSAGKKSQSFDLIDFLTNNLLTSFCTVILASGVFYASGVGREISRAEERSVWSIIKLDKIEQYFGID